VSADLRKSFRDLTWEVPFRGSRIEFMVDFENQSSPDPNMAIRTFFYRTRLWEALFMRLSENERKRRVTLPPVVAVVFYAGSGAWTSERDFSDQVFKSEALGPIAVRTQYVLFDLAKKGPEELRSLGGFWGAVLLLVWCMVVRRFEAEFAEALAGLCEERDREKVEYIVGRLYNTFVKAGLTEQAEIIDKCVLQKEVEVADIFDRFGLVFKETVLEEGRQVGLKEGRAEDLAAQINVICELLRRKGVDPEPWLGDLEKVESVEELSWIIFDLGSASDPEEVLRRHLNGGGGA
jgi:hypothetical protein